MALGCVYSTPPVGLLRKDLAPIADYPPWVSRFHGGQRLPLFRPRIQFIRFWRRARFLLPREGLRTVCRTSTFLSLLAVV